VLRFRRSGLGTRLHTEGAGRCRREKKERGRQNLGGGVNLHTPGVLLNKRENREKLTEGN